MDNTFWGGSPLAAVFLMGSLSRSGPSMVLADRLCDDSWSTR